MMRCQICNNRTIAIISKERNVSCGDYFVGHRIYPEKIGNIILSECESCGFAAFDDLHSWSEEKFRLEIYNDAYHSCDPPFRGERPRKLCRWLSGFLNPCSVIDYGGGEGVLASMLNQNGFKASSYDRFYGDAIFPSESTDVVTAFEVVEHVTAQRRLFAELASLCKKKGIIIFSTLLKPHHLTDDWWYASPRNGHASFHTTESLKLLMHEMNLGYVSLSEEVHVAVHDEGRLSELNLYPSIKINNHPNFAFINEWDLLQKQ